MQKIYDGHGQTLLLHIICVGETVNELEVFLKLGAKKYKCVNIQTAVSACYKIGTLCQKRFPVGSKPIWQFFAEAVYGEELKSIHQRVRTFCLKLGRVVKVKSKKTSKKSSETIWPKKKARKD